MYFPDHKLAIEVDEIGHKDRNEDKEEEKKYRISSVVNLSGLILMKKYLISLCKLVEYITILVDQIKINKSIK